MEVLRESGKGGWEKEEKGRNSSRKEAAEELSFV